MQRALSWLSQAKMSREKLSAENALIVNIWLPRVTNEPSSRFQIISTLYQNLPNTFFNSPPHPAGQLTHAAFAGGHVSFQTPKAYASWSPSSKNREQVGKFTVVDAMHDYNIEVDCEAKGGEPDYRFDLYSLNLKAIEEAYNNIQDLGEDSGYVLGVFRNFLDTRVGHNASSLAMDLLEIGGIKKLEHCYQDVVAKWVVSTPANLAQLLINAKHYELIHFPETQDFSETPLALEAVRQGMAV